MADRSKVKIFNPPHGAGKAIVGDGPPQLDDRLLEKAEAAIKVMEQDFPQLAADCLVEMKSCFERAKANPDGSKKDVRSILTLAMDLKGEAGSYGYQMISEIGELLRRYIQDLETLSARDLQAIAAHIQAMEVVLRDRIKGDGGKVGRQIVDNLHNLATQKK